MSSELEGAVLEHCEQFNAGVRTGDWEPFLSTFTDDAVMTFTNLPLEPVSGRAAIGRLYAVKPPSEEMAVQDVQAAGDGVVAVRFRWASGRAGAMTVRWQGRQVAAVEFTDA